MKNCLHLLLVAMIVSFALGPMVARAQEGSSSDGSPLEIRNAVGTILISGLVGGIIGLSTLSFFPRPQDHIRNIFFGVGAGMIVATLWTTANVASQPVNTIGQATDLMPNLKSAVISPVKSQGKLQRTEPTFALSPYVTPSEGGLFLRYRF